ncbi:MULTISPECIES: peptidase S10 [Rhodomicrobium]|uniref:S10 family peptidase n=1 Tax=Rhodomicrobium TaxID=1068 RepID=UPI000B4BF5F4|nr:MULTISPECIES: peptidase S10 [Rhodomicrobium]
MPHRLMAACALALGLALSPAWAEGPAPETAAKSASAGSVLALPEDVTTQHAIGEGADRIAYSATAGSLPLANDKGETTAKLFYVAYTVSGAQRPITFVFNGGPGAATAFLHLSAMGPRVLGFRPDGAAPAEPIRLGDNPDNWLSFTDLVFVDPVGTGYSRVVGSGEEKSYFGVDQDAKAMTDFVRLYLTRAGRDLADVYIAGESYGGFRAALLSSRLLQGGTRVKGAILISPALEFSMLRGDDFQLTPLALDLPSIAASQSELIGGPNAPLDGQRETEAFARTDYLNHLMQGYVANPAIVTRVARLTGLDPEVVARYYGRVDRSLFMQEFRRRNDRVLSVYDGGISAPVPRPSGRNNPDPILDNAINILTPVMVSYTRDELGYKTDLPYKLLNREVNGAWDWGTKPTEQGFAGSLDELQKARTLNPALKIMIAHGYTDLATPYSVSEFLIRQLKPIETAEPVQFRVYRGGHMMYMRAPSRHALTADARALYGAPSKAP